MGRFLALSIALVLAVAGCRSTSAPAPKAQETAARVADLERLELDGPGILLVKPEHHMGSYDQLMVDPIVVTFAKGSKKLNAAESRRLEAYLHAATARELVNVEASQIVTEPGPCVMRMQIAFVDFDLPELETSSGSRTAFVTSYGSVTLVHELYDSTTGKVLLRYVGRRRAGGGSTSGSLSRWSGLTRTLDKMLSDLQDTLVKHVPLSFAKEGPLAQCQGLIYKGIEVEQAGDGEEWPR
jgi:hypothetical protein